MNRNEEKLNLPNILSILRLGLGPVLIAIAWLDRETIFITVLIFAFLLDLVDGPVARISGHVTEAGSRMDSYADFSIYIAFIAGALMLWPDIVQREWIFLALVAASIILPVLVGLVKFHTPTSYHTWLVKLAAVCMAPSAIILFIGGPAWPFHIATVICVLAGIEEIIITLLLHAPQSNVNHFLNALKCRRDSGNSQGTSD
jgi:CDP-diacylglycerol--glycerol-3-phosphate 3-phosphatidyltransferase